MSEHGCPARQAIAELIKGGVPLNDPRAKGKVAIGPPHI